MKITLTAPPDTEAKVEIDDDAGELSIEPFFANSTGIKNVGSIVVEGKSGQKRRFVMQVSGKNGRVSVTEARQVETEFDKPVKKASPSKPSPSPSGASNG